MKTRLGCSFCQRTSLEVDLLLGGPSTFICSDCVDACSAILADPSVPFPTMANSDDAAILLRLAPAAARVEAAAAGVQGLVDLLRSRGVSWARIGDALGMSRQAAWEKFT